MFEKLRVFTGEGDDEVLVPISEPKDGYVWILDRFEGELHEYSESVHALQEAYDNGELEDTGKKAESVEKAREVLS